MNISIMRKTADAFGIKAFVPFGLPLDKWNYNEKPHDREEIDLKKLNDKKLKELRDLFESKPDAHGTKVLVRDIDAWRYARSGGLSEAGSQKASTVRAFSSLLANYLARVPGHRVYESRDDGRLLAYYVVEVGYKPPTRKNGEYYPPYCWAKVGYRELGIQHTGTWRFEEGECVGTSAAEALAAANLIPETEQLRADYLEEIARFESVIAGIGTQYLATGYGTDDTDDASKDRDSCSRFRDPNRFEFIRDGAKTRVVVDVFNEHQKEDSRDRYIDNSGRFWRLYKAGIAPTLNGVEEGSRWEVEEDEEPSDNPEGRYEIPIHPKLVVFDLAKHMRLRTHVGNLERYKYDPSIIERLILPVDAKALVRLLVDHREGEFQDVVAGKSGGATVLLSGPPGTGKCHGKDTPIMLYDGRCVPVQDVRVGDTLMGEDGSSRLVLSLANGVDDLYRVTPLRGGDPFVVNTDHVMVFKRSGSRKGGEIEMPLRSYLAGVPGRDRLKLYRVPVDFQRPHDVHGDLDPYFLGLWFGDGYWNGASITTPDPEIVGFLRRYAARLGLSIREKVDPRGNKAKTYFLVGSVVGEYHNNRLIRAMDRYALRRKPKRIPHDLLRTAAKFRRALLAGLLDSDGHRCANDGYEITFKSPGLAADVAFLARSLGFSVSSNRKWCKTEFKKQGRRYAGWYTRLHISGVRGLPMRVARKIAGKRGQIKDHLRTGFKVESIGRGRYYGFTLDGNGRYLLGDFTVTHNTLTAEVYAESEGRALYSIQCSQLGIDPDEVEKNLLLAFTRARRWGAVMLLDEADVYVRSRGSDLNQNAIVGVFLRVLEYQTATLFLTTNRPEDVDDAILSRCIARIGYSVPSAEDRAAIWETLSNVSKIKLAEDAIPVLVKEQPTTSGRDIKQLLKLAKVVCGNDPVTPEVVDFVSRFKSAAASPPPIKPKHAEIADRLVSRANAPAEPDAPRFVIRKKRPEKTKP